MGLIKEDMKVVEAFEKWYKKYANQFKEKDGKIDVSIEFDLNEGKDEAFDHFQAGWDAHD